MAGMSFCEFVKFDPRASELFERHFSWRYQFDFYRSLERAFAALIYCARHSEKISYANLATVAGVDEHYVKTKSLGNVMGTILEIIGR